MAPRKKRPRSHPDGPRSNGGGPRSWADAFGVPEAQQAEFDRMAQEAIDSARDPRVRACLKLAAKINGKYPEWFESAVGMIADAWEADGEGAREAALARAFYELNDLLRRGPEAYKAGDPDVPPVPLDDLPTAALAALKAYAGEHKLMLLVTPGTITITAGRTYEDDAWAVHHLTGDEPPALVEIQPGPDLLLHVRHSPRDDVKAWAERHGAHTYEMYDPNEDA